MKDNKDRKQYFKEGNELVLSTCSKKAVPHANIVISLWFVDGKLLVADCQMVTTIKNLKENPSICVISKYYRLQWKVAIYDSGKYFDMCVEKSKGYTVKNALVISADEVFDLDKGEKIL